MGSTLDIFKRLPDGHPEWVEEVAGLNEAKERVACLALDSDADYFIYSVADQAVVATVQNGYWSWARPDDALRSDS